MSWKELVDLLESLDCDQSLQDLKHTVPGIDRVTKSDIANAVAKLQSGGTSERSNARSFLLLALARLATVDGNYLEALDRGALQIVLAEMNSCPVSSCDALAVLVRNAEQARICLENGVMATIVSLWKAEGDSVGTQSACCRALASIVAAQAEGDRLLTCRAAAELSIHSFMKRFPEKVEAQISACELAHYVLDEDDSQLGHGNDRDAFVQPLLDDLRAFPHDARLQRNAMFTLARCAAQPAEHARCNDVINLVTTGMQRHDSDPEVQVAGCDVICSCFIDRHEGLHILGPAFVAVVSGMKLHLDDIEVQESGCLALTRLLGFWSHHRDKVPASAEAIVAALRAHPDSEGLLEAACEALIVGYCFASDKTTGAFAGNDLACEAIGLLLAALRRHIDSPWPHGYNICKAMSYIFSDASEAVMLHAQQLGAMELLQELTARWSGQHDGGSAASQATTTIRFLRIGLGLRG